MKTFECDNIYCPHHQASLWFTENYCVNARLGGKYNSLENRGLHKCYLKIKLYVLRSVLKSIHTWILLFPQYTRMLISLHVRCKKCSSHTLLPIYKQHVRNYRFIGYVLVKVTFKAGTQYKNFEICIICYLLKASWKAQGKA